MVTSAPEVIGRGVYNVSDAARLVGTDTGKLRRWVFGGRGQRAVIDNDYAPINGVEALSFNDLIEARFVSAFRSQGVSLQHLRQVSSKARAELSSKHPFADGRFVTDGRRIILEEVDEAGRRQLTDYVSEQRAFEEFIRSLILPGVVFDASNFAARWFPDSETPDVCVDPRRTFGRPMLFRTGTPTDIVAKALRVADDDVGQIASAYDLHPREVHQAALFELRLAA